MLRIEALPHIAALHREQNALAQPNYQKDDNSPPLHNLYKPSNYNPISIIKVSMSVQSDEETLDRESYCSIEELLN